MVETVGELMKVQQEVRKAQQKEFQEKKQLEKQQAEQKSQKIQQRRENFKRLGKKVRSGVSRLYQPVGKKIQTRPSAMTQKAFFKVFGAGGSSNPQQKGTRPVGRPPGNYRNPAGVPAQQWYKIKRQMKRQAQIRAEQAIAQQQQQFAKQGVPPQQVQQVEMNKLRQRFQQTQVPNRPVSNNVPQQPQQVVVPQQQSIWNRRGYVSEDWGLFGKRRIIRGLPFNRQA